MKSQNFGKKVFLDHFNSFKIYEKTSKIYLGVYQNNKFNVF